MVAGKTIGLLALLAIAGVTGAVAVLVSPDGVSARRTNAPRRTSEPNVRPRPQLTSTSDVRATALHRAHLEATDRVDCASCHDLRASDFRAPPDRSCLGCHKGHEPAVHGSAPAAACLTCHDFLLPEGATAWARACQTCHDRVQGSHPAIAIHKEQDCGACHAVHPRRDTTPAACLGCHDTRATHHPAGDAARVCSTCHAPHRPAREARASCEACHVAGARDLPARARIPSTALFRGHDRCLQCHTGHTFTRASVKACRDCHPGKGALASEKVAAHAACTSCHGAHAAQSPPVARCAECHAQIATSSKHPRDPRGRDCVGCHPPHQDLGASRSALGCTDRCHADKGNASHGTAACGDCHVRHRFTLDKPPPAQCLGCHARAIGGAPAIATSAGHARCASCHPSGAHRPAAARPACATCHAPEASTVPAGHADCKTCHDVHAGKLRPQAARCESCHADRARTPHIRVPGGCRACHRPHGPDGPAKAPPCSQCHATASLAGLHVAPGHRSCASCHLAHAPEIAGREPCLRCHTDRRDHEPAARWCQACHPFGAKPR